MFENFIGKFVRVIFYHENEVVHFNRGTLLREDDSFIELCDIKEGNKILNKKQVISVNLVNGHEDRSNRFVNEHTR